MDIVYLSMTLGVSLAINIALFLIAFRLQSDKLTDISYALSFAVIALWAFMLSDHSLYHTMLCALVLIWAVRLGGFLLQRIIKNGKDKRFDDMRGSFFRFGKFWVAQAITVWVMMLPSIFAFSSSATIGVIGFIGISIWAIGLVCETIADMQKARFKNDTSNKNKWIETGIWRYSRHPNYFGEIMV